VIPTTGISRAVTEADADALACDVAVIVANRVRGRVTGAVYQPVGVIVPQFPKQPFPPTLQVTAVFRDPVTVEENCCEVPEFMLKLPEGEMLTLGVPAKVTIADEDLVKSARDLAVTVTTPETGGVLGAV